MAEQKQCVRCERAIDRYARLCVYCNWDQASLPPANPQTAVPPGYVPPTDHRARNKLLGIVAFVAIVIIAFVVGTLIHGFEPGEVKAASTKQTTPEPANMSTAPRSNVTLVPVTDGMPAPVEQPITSAPPQAPGQEASDATALPSDEYASVAAKAKAAKAAAQHASMVDPRSLRGRAYEEEPAPKRVRSTDNELPPPQASATGPTHGVQTEAFPEYRPLPPIHVPQDTQARLSLDVNSEGKVTGVDIIDPVPGATAQIVDAVQNWRFRPATINGNPVPAKVTVTITLRANE